MIINNTFKSPSYKPANLGFPTGSQKLTVPVRKPDLKVGQGWKDAFKGKTVDDLKSGKPLNPNKESKPTSGGTVGAGRTVTPVATSGIISTGGKGAVTTPTPESTVQTSTPPTRNVTTDRERRFQERQKKGLLQPNQTSFGFILERIQGASSPTQQQKGLTKRMEREADENRRIADQAKAYSEMYGDEIARVGQLGAGAVAGNLSTGTNVVGSGNAAIASQSASQRMQALSQAQQAALAGTGQQLTGQSQLQSALNQAAGNVNTQQAQQLSGLGTAGSLAAPNPAQYGQTVFDPITGQFTGGTLDPQTQATNLAQQVMSGRMTYDQAIASLGYAGAAGSNFLNNALTSMGGNPLSLQAQSVAQQSNITTQGTLGTNIAAAGLSSVTPQYVQVEANANAAKQQAGRALQILEETGLNNVSSTDYNRVANELRSRMGDPNFAAFQTAIEEAKNFYTSVLAGGGGTPSGQQEIANSIAALNTNSPISAIVASLRELESASATRLQSFAAQQQQFQSNLGGGGGGFSGGGTGSGSIWDW